MTAHPDHRARCHHGSGRRGSGHRTRAPGLAAGTIRRLSVVICLVAAVFLPTSATAHAAPDPQPGSLCAAMWGYCDTRATDNGYIYAFSGGRLHKVPTAVGTARPADSCADCPVRLDFCNVGPETTGFEQLLWAAFPEAAADTHALCNPQAIAAAPTLAQVQASLVNYLREQALPRPTLVVQPNGRSFANLPTVLYTPVPPSFTFNVDQPLLATISAVPHYRWDFGDGTLGPDSPGRPFDPAISPREHPEAYVAHAYRQPGTYPITLTVTWQGTFAVPGVGQAFPLAPVTLAANAAVVVDEASGVLTGNN
ncbi:PKD domain-containing protein [Frankia sp. Cj3]|uniref:PKD domain-containing protein n=1 Tax=Frankia sp. Cj3 TaxID=2880976 RepID=UPI001EF6710B|nr:PKD domain-containing protein [Frankia sp. Cj3]